MLSMLRSLLLTTLLLPVLALCVLLGLAFYLLQDEPLVERTAPADFATVDAGKALVKRMKTQVESADQRGTALVVSRRELDHLAQLGAHTFKWLDMDFDIDSAGIHARASARMPRNPFGDYLNLGLQFGESDQGVGIDRVTVGPAGFSGRWVLPLVARLLDLALPDKQASAMLESVHSVRIAGDTAQLTVYPPPDAKAQLKQAVRTLQASRFPPGEEERVGHYYTLLVGMGGTRDGSPRSLSAYLIPLMAEAAQRSRYSDAVTENRAAIWALAIYFSNGAFETLVGKLVSGQRPLVQSPAGVVLAERQDLMAHFLYSAGITLATRQGIGVAAGEFKELLDSGNGGSGFSFADLAADRAGIDFVNAATASEESARQLQQRIIASRGEASFFPDISGLVEGLGEEQFREQYGSVESARYREQVKRIDERIARLRNVAQ
jgi:hypothetical protein